MILARREARCRSAAISASLSDSLAIMMVATGVLNAWVMLLMKSVFISDIFFWRSMVKIVYMKLPINTSSRVTDENSITVMLPISRLSLLGKYTARRPDEL